MKTLRVMAAGTVLKERFVLQERIGVGGMGTVYKALDLRAQEAHDKNPYLAIKLLKPELVAEPIFFVAMQRETKKAQALAHPNIITVYDFDRDGPNVFLSMELLTGKPLSSVIREHPKGMTFQQAWPIIEGMAAALAYAHQQGIIHSDFKPGNVFIDDRNRVKVLDFGIACRFNQEEASDGDTTVFHSRSLGALSPAYASLEMFGHARPDPRDDIYALACVTYELLAGRHPFLSANAQQVQELQLEPKPIPALGKKQWRGLMRALALKREDRTKTVEQFLADLAPSASPARQRVMKPVALAALLIGVLAGGGWFLKGGTQTLSRLAAVMTAPKAEGARAEQAQKQHLRLRLSAPGYAVGEAIILFVETEKPMYVTLVHIGSNGEAATIFPNAYEPKNWMAAGVPLRIPSERAGYELTASGPPGLDRIEAFGSAEPLPADRAILGPDGEVNPELRDSLLARVRLDMPIF